MCKGAREGNAALECATRYALFCHLLSNSRFVQIEVLLILTDGEMENEKRIVEELK